MIYYVFIFVIILLLLFFWYRQSFNNIPFHNGIPSYYSVNTLSNTLSNTSAFQLHQLLQLHHSDILTEVTSILDTGISSEESILTDEKKWNPIWIKYMGESSGISNKFPFLQNISNLFPDIANIYVSILYPGTTVVENSSNSNNIFDKYHYGLQIADNDIGLKIDGFDVKWQNKESFLWDSSIPHAAWNHTNLPRIVIFADIIRNTTMAQIKYKLLQYQKCTPQIKDHLKYINTIYA